MVPGVEYTVVCETINQGRNRHVQQLLDWLHFALVKELFIVEAKNPAAKIKNTAINNGKCLIS